MKMDDVFYDQRKFLSNLQYYCNGYSVYSLIRILPAHTLFVAIDGMITSNEIKVLRKIRNRACIMTSKTALSYLEEADIKPDFIFLEPTLEKNEGDILAKWKDTPLVTCTLADEEFMKLYDGFKFFYWNNNAVEKSIWFQAWRASSKKYQYNKLFFLDVSEDILLAMVNIGKQMGAKCVLVGGSNAIKSKVQSTKNIRVTYINDWNENNDSDIQIRLSNILSEILPFFDEQGQQVFCEEYKQLKTEIQLCASSADEGIELYQELYDIAEIELIGKSDILSTITSKIKQITASIEQGKYFDYIWSLTNRISDSAHTCQDKDCKSEIMQIAIDGISILQKIKLVCESVVKIVKQLPNVNCMRKKINYRVQHQRNILLVFGSSAYNVLPRFTWELEKGFRKLGYQTFIWDVCKDGLNPDGAYNFYQSVIGYNYILLMNGVLIDNIYNDWVMNQKRYWYESDRTQVLALYVDHPLYHSIRLSYSCENVKTIIMDTRDEEFLHKYMSEVKNVFCVPIGGVEQKNERLFEQKENKVVFFGSFLDIELIKKSIQESGLESLIWQVIGLLKKKTTLTIDEAFECIGREYDCATDVRKVLTNSEIFELIDKYIRNYYRNQVILTIAESGIPVDFYGVNNSQLEKYSNVQLKASVPFEIMLEICRNTRFVLNVNPWTKGGTEERVFNAMLGKSVCITDVNEYLAQEFSDGQNVIFYELDKIEELPTKIKYYMEHEELAARIAENGYGLAKKKFTWAKIAEQIVDKIGMPKD